MNCLGSANALLNYNVTGNGGRECDRKVEKIKDLVHAEIKAYIKVMVYISAKYHKQCTISSQDLIEILGKVQRLSKANNKCNSI